MQRPFFSRAILLFSITVSICSFSCNEDEILVRTNPNEMITFRTPPPEVPAILEVPEGNVVSKHVYAAGVQVYVSTETSPGVFAWVFREPIADLFNNTGMTGQAGTHYAGPTWESNSGSKVVGARLQGATVDPDAILWLLLGVVTSSGPGIFDGTTYIQRTSTSGGKAPVTPAANAGNVGQESHVPYTAEYYFYKAE